MNNLLILMITIMLGQSVAQVWKTQPESGNCMDGESKTFEWHYTAPGATELGIVWRIDGNSLLIMLAGGSDSPASGYDGKVKSSITSIHNAGIKLMNCADFSGNVISVTVTFSGSDPPPLASTVNPTVDSRPASDFTYMFRINDGNEASFVSGTEITETAAPLTITITSSTSPPVTMYVVDTSDGTQTPQLPVDCSSPSAGCSLTIDHSFIGTELQLVVDTDASDDLTVRFIKSAAFTPTESSAEKPGNKLSPGVIAGIVVGCVAAVVSIISIIVCCNNKLR